MVVAGAEAAVHEILPLGIEPATIGRVTADGILRIRKDGAIV